MIVNLPPREKYQQDVLDFHLDNPKENTVVVKSPRQVGKSDCIVLLLIASSLSDPNNESICVSPIFKQAKKIYKDLCRVAHPVIDGANSTDLDVMFKNGSTVRFLSAESGQNLRGYTVKGPHSCLIIDEAAYIDTDIFFEVLKPFCNVHRSNILLFSTPRFKQGLFFELYQKGLLGEPGIKTFDWCTYDLSKLLPNDLLEQYRQQMPRRVFTSEYQGEFIDGDSVIFGNTRSCIGTFSPNPEDELDITIDWGGGTGNDDTAITIGQLSDGKVQVERILTFNDKSTNQTIDIILILLKEYVRRGFKSITVIVESNSIGTVYYSVLMDKLEEWENVHNPRGEVEITLRTFTTTNASKNRIIEELSALFENGRILIPDDKKLISELSTYECKVSDKGVATYNAASGFHDDMVMSLAFMADYNWQYI